MLELYGAITQWGNSFLIMSKDPNVRESEREKEMERKENMKKKKENNLQ